MTRRHRTRSQRTYFPFAKLPPDVQLLVLGNLHLHALQNIIRAIPGVQDLFLMYPTIIWEVATASMGPQIRNFLMTALRLAHSIKYVQADSQPDLGNMDHFMAKHLYTDCLDRQVTELLQCDASGALEMLCEIDDEVVTLAKDCALLYYERACETDNPGAVIPPLILSTTETYRLTRAFYRLKLFGMFFHLYQSQSGVSLMQAKGDFFATISGFELDEMIIAYHFLNQNRGYLPLMYMRKDCVCTEPASSQAIRQETQEECCHECMQAHIRSSTRMLLSFWQQLLDRGCIDLRKPWENLTSRLAVPCTSWKYVPEADQPNAGWLLWSKLRDDTRGIVNVNDYMDYFVRLGYCFWDAARLVSWGEVFTEEWFIEERDAYRSWCTSR